MVLHDSEDTEEIIERVAGLDIGKAELVACIQGAQPGPAGPSGAGDHDLLDDDPVAAGSGRPAG